MARARILAIDDQRYFRELIEGLLIEEGYEVETTSTGEDALHILQRDDFDVVITDLVMPGIDGTQLVQRIKERHPDQEIVMVTGVVDVKTAVDAMKQGATDYILKPFDRNDLARSLDNILQRKRLRDEHARLMEENLEYMGVLSLYERAAGLFSTLSVEPLAERLIEGLCLETRSQGGVLWVAAEVGDTRLAMAGARGLIRIEEEPEEIRLDHLGDDLRPLLEEGSALVRPRQGGPDDDEALFVPLRHAGHLVALARLSDKLEADRFDDLDRAAAEKFASFGTTAMVNALRFRGLERRSFRDPTTKAYSHAYFQDVVRNEIQKATRFGRGFAIIQADLGPLSELRRRLSERELANWLESLAHHIGTALRSTDLMAAESDSRFSVLLPETDAVGAAVLKQRIREVLAERGVLEAVEESCRPDLALAHVAYPNDGTQLESLTRVLDKRLAEHRRSLVRRLDLAERPFGQILESLLAQAQPGRRSRTRQIAHFLLDEVARRPRDRGLLFLAPGPDLQEAVFEGLEGLGSGPYDTEIVMVSDRASESSAGQAITWLKPRSLTAERPFFLYYGDGPAYALVTGEPDGRGGQPFFHTGDRALVEQMAFQLQRDLGIPLGV